MTSLSNFNQESINYSSSKEGEDWKLGLGELYSFNNDHSRKNKTTQKKVFLNLDDFINANYNYESLRSCRKNYPNSNKKCKNFESSTQEDLVAITFDELISEDKIRKNDSKNMIVLQNDVRSISMYVKILMDSVASASIIHLYVQINLILVKLPRISGPQWLDHFWRRALLKLKLNFQN